MRTMRTLALFWMLAGAALWAASCGGGDGGTTEPPTPANRAPTAVGSLAALTIEVGAQATVNVASNFSDPDGDALTYVAASSNSAVATASVAGSAVAVAGVNAGSATITVTASDPGGLSATQTMGVTVEAPNRAPTAVGSLAAQTIVAGAEVTVDVASNFNDPDGDALVYAAASSDNAVATASVSGSTVAVAGIGGGSATIDPRADS